MESFWLNSIESCKRYTLGYKWIDRESLHYVIFLSIGSVLLIAICSGLLLKYYGLRNMGCLIFFFIKDTCCCKQWHDFCTQTSLFYFFLFKGTSCNMFFCYRFTSSAWLICSLFKGSLIAQVLDISSFSAENSSMIWKSVTALRIRRIGMAFLLS